MAGKKSKFVGPYKKLKDRELSNLMDDARKDAHVNRTVAKKNTETLNKWNPDTKPYFQKRWERDIQEHKTRAVIRDMQYEQMSNEYQSRVKYNQEQEEKRKALKKPR